MLNAIKGIGRLWMLLLDANLQLNDVVDCSNHNGSVWICINITLREMSRLHCNQFRLCAWDHPIPRSSSRNVKWRSSLTWLFLTVSALSQQMHNLRAHFIYVGYKRCHKHCNTQLDVCILPRTQVPTSICAPEISLWDVLIGFDPCLLRLIQSRYKVLCSTATYVQLRRLLKSLFDIWHSLVNTVYTNGIKLVGSVQKVRVGSHIVFGFCMYIVWKHHANLQELIWNLIPARQSWRLTRHSM